MYLVPAIRSYAPVHLKNGLADPRTSVVAPPPRDTPTFFNARPIAAFSAGVYFHLNYSAASMRV